MPTAIRKNILKFPPNKMSKRRYSFVNNKQPSHIKEQNSFICLSVNYLQVRGISRNSRLKYKHIRIKSLESALQ